MTEAERIEGEQEKTRALSGAVFSYDPFVIFLYLLERDYLSSGVVTGLVNDASTGNVSCFTNGWLAKHAQHLADRLAVRPDADPEHEKENPSTVCATCKSWRDTPPGHNNNLGPGPERLRVMSFCSYKPGQQACPTDTCFAWAAKEKP